MNCPFCDILAKNTERIIRESKNTFTVLSNPRLVSGHLLVIPKRHVEKFSELSAEERSELFNETIKLEEIILEKFASGCDMSQHYRPFIQQNRLKINHLHIHLRPREFEDELYQKVMKYERDVFIDLSQEEFEKCKKVFA
ncbi:MAG: HIT family protein [Parcubacteria group bacterium]|nr:HIT family protein [Parcubacteria group bacterium]